MTRRSQTGILIYCNYAPIIWYSKRQNAVEDSSFGAEFVAMRTLIEMLIGLRYKLRMFGVPFDGGGVLHWIGTTGDTQPYRNPQSTGEVQSI